MKRDWAEAETITANFVVRWADGHEEIEQRKIRLGSALAEAIKLDGARGNLLGFMKSYAAVKGHEQRRLIDVIRKSAEKPRTCETADELARFLFGG